MTDPPRLEHIAPKLTPREIAVASYVGRRIITKRIATELGISESRVYALLASVALKIGVPDGEDDRQFVGDWWRSHLIVLEEDAA